MPGRPAATGSRPGSSGKSAGWHALQHLVLWWSEDELEEVMAKASHSSKRPVKNSVAF
jgi:hypothetical protein